MYRVSELCFRLRGSSCTDSRHGRCTTRNPWYRDRCAGRDGDALASHICRWCTLYGMVKAFTMWRVWDRAMTGKDRMRSGSSAVLMHTSQSCTLSLSACGHPDGECSCPLQQGRSPWHIKLSLESFMCNLDVSRNCNGYRHHGAREKYKDECCNTCQSHSTLARVFPHAVVGHKFWRAGNMSSMRESQCAFRADSAMDSLF